MDRRTFARLGVGIGLVALGGCLGTIAQSTDDDREEESTAEQGASSDATLSESTADEPLEQFAIGDADAADESVPHLVYVWNAADDDQTMSVRVVHEGETVLERTESVPADAYLAIELHETGSYETAVTVGSASNETTITRSDADCDESRTIMAFRAQGIQTTTTMSC